MIRVTTKCQAVILSPAPKNVSRSSPLDRVPNSVPGDELDGHLQAFYVPPIGVFAVLEIVTLNTVLRARVVPERPWRGNERGCVQVGPDKVA